MYNEKLLREATALFPEIKKNKINECKCIDLKKDGDVIKRDPRPAYRSIALKKDDSIILDFEDHYVGYLTLDLGYEGAHPDSPVLLRIRFAEREIELFEDASEYKGWVSPAWIEEELIHVDIVPSVVELDRRYSFRYVRIEVVDISSRFSLRVNDAAITAVSSAPDEALLPYYSSDELDMEIDRVAVKTLHDCMQTVFEDGPKRDRRLWIGDLRIQALVNYVTYNMNDMVKSNLYLFGALTQEDGRVGACIFLDPKPEVDDTNMFDYSLFFIVILRDYYKKTGDKKAVLDLFDVCKRQIELARQCLDERFVIRDSDVLGWCFVDWNLALNKQASAQGIFMYALEAAIELAQCVGDVLAEEEYAQLYLKLKEASNRFLYDVEKKLYVSGAESQISFASQIWMVLGGAMEGKAAERLFDRMEACPEAVTMVTPYMYHNYIDALIKIGKKDVAHRKMSKYWGGMVANSADTFWELYNPENPNESPYGGTIVNSYCHAWSCGPAYFLRTYFNDTKDEL